MDFKTKGKEGTNAKGQKKENAKLGKVNKKLVNDDERPGKEKKDDADDISNNFPNFSVLNQEEKLAFFEALSAARKNIEKRGLPTRERFGTVHDEYLQYFVQDDKGETVQKKPESAPSGGPSRSPVPSRKSPKESKLGSPDSPKQGVHKTPESTSPPKKTAKPPQKNLRPESEPNDFCESVIKRDTDQMIQMYLNKKKRIEEQWKKDALASKSPPPKPKSREVTRPPSGRAPTRKEDPRAKTPSKPVAASNTPQFQALNPVERKEFFRTLKEAHNNILFKNPQQDDILSLDEVLKPYKGDGGKVTACPATHQQCRKQQQQQQQKNLRVKVTLTSGDNKRLSRTKSQVLNDSTKEGSGGKSKSLESVVCPDMPHGKQSKIPILRKAPQDRNDSNDIKTETQPVKKIACEDSVGPKAADAIKREAAELKATEVVEPKKTEAPVKEKTLTIKEEPEKKEEIKMTTKEKKLKKREEVSEECIQSTAGALAKAKAELKKVRKEKQEAVKEKEKAVKEKTKALAEAAKKEKEMLRNKRKQEWKKRHQKREALKKGASKEDDCWELKVVGVSIRREKFLEEQKKKKSVCEKEELTTKKTNEEKEDKCDEKKVKCEEKKDECDEKKDECEEKKDECEEKKDECDEKKDRCEEKKDECDEKELPRMETDLKKEDECKEQELPKMQANEEKIDECSEEISTEKECQKTDCVQKEEEEEEDEEDEDEESGESCSSVEECQQSSECRAVAEECQQPPPCDSFGPRACKEGPGHHDVFSSLTCNEPVVKAATQSTKSLAGVSLLEQRPEETWQAQEMVPTFTTGKVVVVDDNVIKRIKDLIQYLDKKANSKENLQSEYVRLVLSYTEYLTRVTESLILGKKPKKGQQVHSTYAAPEVRLKFEDGDDEAPKSQKKAHIPHSVSESDFQGQTLPGTSGIEKKEDSRRKRSTYDLDLSDSESSTNSEEENRTLTQSTFRKTAIPMTKIRLLQDLLNGRAKFEEGSIDDFKIVHIPEAEYVPPEKPPTEEAKEISDADIDQGQKAVGMKFLRNLAKLCNCGKKQVEEDAILENLKGEAVRVDTAEVKKDPASATINDSTMEVLKAAERKKIIEKYLKKEQS